MNFPSIEVCIGKTRGNMMGGAEIGIVLLLVAITAGRVTHILIARNTGAPVRAPPAAGRTMAIAQQEANPERR